MSADPTTSLTEADLHATERELAYAKIKEAQSLLEQVAAMADKTPGISDLDALGGAADALSDVAGGIEGADGCFVGRMA